MKKQYKFIIAGSIIVVAAAIYSGIQNSSWWSQRNDTVRKEQEVRTREQILVSEVSRLNELSRSTSTSLSIGVSGQNVLSIAPQEEGTAIIIDAAVFERPGFIVVFTLDPKTKQYNFFNASPYFERGAYKILSIAAPTKLSPSTTYKATIYADTNGSKALEEADDTAATMPTGERFEVPILVKNKKK